MNVYLLIHRDEYGAEEGATVLRGVYTRHEDAEADRTTRDGPIGIVHDGCCRIEEHVVHDAPLRADAATA